MNRWKWPNSRPHQLPSSSAKKKKKYNSTLYSGRLMKNKILCRCASPNNKSPYAVTIANRMFAFLVSCSYKVTPLLQEAQIALYLIPASLAKALSPDVKWANQYMNFMCVISLARSNDHPYSWIACPSSRLQSWLLFGWTQSTQLRHKLEAG